MTLTLSIATLVAPRQSPAVLASALDAARRALDAAGAPYTPGETRDARAVALRLGGLRPADARALLEPVVADLPVDLIVAPVARCRLFIADMDSTMITVECIDELADFVGKKAQVSAVTEAAMRGELDFEQALDARVALLAGLPEAALHACYDQRVAPNLTPGGRGLIQALNADGARTVLVSGGFTFFVDRVAAALGFQHAQANVLELAGGALTGRVLRPIVTAAVKRAALLAHAAELGCALEDTVAIGDGANDIPMIEAAGLGIAYHAKPKTIAAADAAIRHGDLSTVHYALGLGSNRGDPV